MLRKVASVEILICWIVWLYPFVVRMRRQDRPSVTVSFSLAGLGLEVAAIFVAVFFHVPFDAPMGITRFIAAIIPGPIAVWMGWSAVKHLGRQLRFQAGLYEDHELVCTGAYAIVRHPIYSSMLLMLLAIVIAMTQPLWIGIAIALYIAGTEIRVRTEDALLASRFPREFAEYRAKVPAYIPFVR
ncbi:MAG TPA: isoprenylcysteine carboxylmethyltransferase family protein [Bryobacteraceae bacterium]|nr:isoprenylcysteine carboxylmethyltransferase family protein [Bryobacteraceae bacterium]